MERWDSQSALINWEVVGSVVLGGQNSDRWKTAYKEEGEEWKKKETAWWGYALKTTGKKSKHHIYQDKSRLEKNKQKDGSPGRVGSTFARTNTRDTLITPSVETKTP